jgi:hypothetical protein
MKNSTSNRKTFIKNSLAALAAVVTTPLAAQEIKPSKTVKMLTADGKLVEVNSEVVKQAPKKKVSSKEILNWRTLKG